MAQQDNDLRIEVDEIENWLGKERLEMRIVQRTLQRENAALRQEIKRLQDELTKIGEKRQ